MPFFKRSKQGEESTPQKPPPTAAGGEPPDAPLEPAAVRASRTPLQLPASPPQLELNAGQYASSEEHLWDELRRIDLYVRAQTILWRETTGASKPAQMWGMVNVTDAEMDAYLQSPFLPLDYAAAGVEDSVAGFWQTIKVLAESIRTRIEMTPPDVPLRLETLRTLFRLSDLEYNVLLVCLLPELDGRYRRLFGYLQDDASRVNPSVELVLNLLRRTDPDADAGRAVFASASPLLENHLLILRGDAESEEPLSVRSVRVDDRMAGYLTGSDALDSRLRGIVRWEREHALWEDLIIEPERQAQLEDLSEWYRSLRDGAGGSLTLFLRGPEGGGRLTAARAFCTATQTPLLFVDAAAVRRSPDDDELLIDLAYREAKLLGAALYWARCEQLLDASCPPHIWSHLTAAAEKFRGLTFLASSAAWEPSGCFHETPYLRLDFPMPAYELRRRIWEARLPPAEQFAEPAPERSALADRLANSFQLTEGQIVDALCTAREEALRREPQEPRLTVSDLYDGCRRQSNRSLAAFARRLEPHAGFSFEHLILPPPNKRQLDDLRFRISARSQVRRQFEKRLTLGRGLIALFTGASGTGKTMAAGLLAQEQGVDLYKIDLSAVVSKYVGETEKNLNTVFAEAEDANAIIFFDEGEALFGQRGSKNESGQDRWANMEINYLLQRVEEYTGVVILASNLRQNIDEAFMR
ncbi:MAG: AAA family ATPase, partial [Acidobacteria bacterium]|nr:AAA family ATPase [Acidobacteriota bacterium]